MQFPELLRTNAYDGETVAKGKPDPEWRPSEPPTRKAQELELPSLVNWADWRDSRVGWGIIAAAPNGLTDRQLVENADLPDCLRHLIRDRGNAPVFRYIPRWSLSFSKLRNYGGGWDVEVRGSAPGLGRDCLPQYLLIVGGPAAVPWRLQFALNSTRHVGRLPLAGDALENYVCHLESDWAGSSSQVDYPVVWATDQGHPDITDLLTNVLAKPLHEKYRNHDYIGEKAVGLFGADATRSMLQQKLERHRPAVIVTASHGMTGPLLEPNKIPGTLGLLVDQNRQLLEPGDLFNGWQPDGAIWYAHACCSAGTTGATEFKALVPADSNLGRTVAALSSVGERLALLPLALLSAPKPARAFIGHVEPTFDLTLRDEKTGQWFTGPMIEGLYSQIYLRQPLGLAMKHLLGGLAGADNGFVDVELHFKGDDTSYALRLNYALRGLDLARTVLLGDPTVTAPDFPRGVCF